MNEITPINSNGNPYPIKVNEDEFKKRVDSLSYDVLRKAATEVAFTGEYTDSEVIGVYKCKACSSELFRSETKFHSGCGWPSFYAPTENDAVELIEDRSLFPRVRTAYPSPVKTCPRCEPQPAHLTSVLTLGKSERSSISSTASFSVGA